MTITDPAMSAVRDFDARADATPLAENSAWAPARSPAPAAEDAGAGRSGAFAAGEAGSASTALKPSIGG